MTKKNYLWLFVNQWCIFLEHKVIFPFIFISSLRISSNAFWSFHPSLHSWAKPPSLPSFICLSRSVLKKPIKYSWCCLYTLDCVAFHSSMGGPGRAAPLKKTCWPFPVVTSYPLARAGPARPPPVSMLGFCLASPYTDLLAYCEIFLAYCVLATYVNCMTEHRGWETHN